VTAAEEVIDKTDVLTLVEVVQLLTAGTLNSLALGKRAHDLKRRLEMRKDPAHESWMEER